MRTKMSARRACLTAVIMSVPPTFLFAINSGRFSTYAVLIASILINWPLIRWLDDRQWYREWKRVPMKLKRRNAKRPGGLFLFNNFFK